MLVPLLRELFAQQGVFPTPWAIRIGLEARGIPVGPLPLPLSRDGRRRQAAYIEWVPGWLARVEQALGLSLVGAR